MNRAASLGIFIASVLAPPVAGVLRGMARGGEGAGLTSFMGLFLGGALIIPICLTGIVAGLVFRKHPRKTWIVAAAYLCSSALASWFLVAKLLD